MRGITRRQVIESVTFNAATGEITRNGDAVADANQEAVVQPTLFKVEPPTVVEAEQVRRNLYRTHGLVELVFTLGEANRLSSLLDGAAVVTPEERNAVKLFQAQVDYAVAVSERA